MDLDKLKQDYANYLINTATIDQVKDLVTSSLTVVGCANVLRQQANKAIEEMGDEQREELDKQLNPPKEEEVSDGNPEE
jgi:putative N-acetylmannosamine-6-phosphate epimerase